MIRHPLGSNRTVTLFPYSTLFRPSAPFGARSEPRDRTDAPDLGRARFWADAGVGRFSVLFASTGVGRSYGRWPASWWDVARRGPGCAAGRPRRFRVLSCYANRDRWGSLPPPRPLPPVGPRTLRLGRRGDGARGGV